MSIVRQQNPFSSSALAPFTTVNNGGARPLKAISASEFSTMQNGSVVYVESVRDYYKWNTTSTETDDTGTATSLNRYCNPTTNGVAAGRFERLFLCSPDWLLQDFFIDSSTGNNENSGSVLAPLATDAELFQRWSAHGTAYLNAPRQVTYAQAPTNGTRYNVGVLTNANFKLIGTPITSQSGVVITAVQAQVRTAGAEVPHAITGATLGAGDVGKLAIIRTSATPAHVGASARILKDLGGGKVMVSPFVKGNIDLFIATTEITPSVNDTIDVFLPMQLPVASIRVQAETIATFGGTVAAPINTFTAEYLLLDGLDTGGSAFFISGAVFSSNLSCFYSNCILSNLTIVGPVDIDSNGHTVLGGGIDGFTTFSGSTFISKSGLLDAIILFTDQFGQIDTDTYFQNSNTIVNGAGRVNSYGAAFWNQASASNFNCPYNIEPGGVVQSGTGVPDWGTNNAGYGMFIRSGAFYGYATKPTINGTLGVGREALIGGTDKLYATVPYFEVTNGAALVLIA